MFETGGFSVCFHSITVHVASDACCSSTTKGRVKLAAYGRSPGTPRSGAKVCFRMLDWNQPKSDDLKACWLDFQGFFELWRYSNSEKAYNDLLQAAQARAKEQKLTDQDLYRLGSNLSPELTASFEILFPGHELDLEAVKERGAGKLVLEVLQQLL